MATVNIPFSHREHLDAQQSKNAVIIRWQDENHKSDMSIVSSSLLPSLSIFTGQMYEVHILWSIFRFASQAQVFLALTF